MGRWTSWAIRQWKGFEVSLLDVLGSDKIKAAFAKLIGNDRYLDARIDVLEGGGVLFHGSGPPASALGQIDDYYRDDMAGLEYGPKTALGWGNARRIGPPTAAETLAALLGVDGAGSKLDADLLDGNEATAFEVKSDKDQANGYAALGADRMLSRARLGTGTTDATTFLRGDKTWAVPPVAGGSGIGSIDGVSVPTGGNIDLQGIGGILITPNDAGDTITFDGSGVVGGGSTQYQNHVLAAHASGTNITIYGPETEMLNNQYSRTYADLTGITAARFYLAHGSTVPSAATYPNACMRVQYTTDLTGATGWAYLDGADGYETNVTTPTSVKVSTERAIPAAAKGPVLLRIVTANGDAAATTPPATNLRLAGLLFKRSGGGGTSTVGAKQLIPMRREGAMTVGTGPSVPTPFPFSLTDLEARLDAAGSGTSLVVHVYKNGVNVDTVTFAVGATSVSQTGLAVAFARGDKYALRVDSQDSGGTATGLSVVLGVTF